MRLKSDLQQAIVLREAGLTLSAIVDKTGLSASTLYRVFKKHDIGRGDLTNESIEEARNQMLNDAGFIDQLKYTIASSIVDDLSLVKRIRESLILALEEINKDTATSGTLKARSLAAFSTSLKITQEVQRKALNIDSFHDNQANEKLPILTICKMTTEDVQQVQDRLSDDDDSIFGNQ